LGIDGKRPKGRPQRIFIDQLTEDTNIAKENLAAAMEVVLF